MDAEQKTSARLAIILRVSVFIFLMIVGLRVFAWALIPSGPLIQGAMSTFAAAAIANAVVLRIWERGQMAQIGLGGGPPARRNLLIGLAGGVGSALAVILVPVILRVADIVPDPQAHFNAGSLLFVSLALLFGAVGEELLFRGYAFQVLIGALGTWATILPLGVLFAFAHLANPNQNTLLGPLNTALWGIVLGYAFVRSGDLWLPIGIHFGWNWTLPLFGANLSGFTMGVTGLTLRWQASDAWSGGAYGPEGGLFTTIVLAGLVWFLHRAPVWEQTPLLARPREAT